MILHTLHLILRLLVLVGLAAAPAPGQAVGDRVPAGCFRMGAADHFTDERPVHAICVDAFLLDRTEVTAAAYAACVAAGRCTAARPFDPASPTRRRCTAGHPGRTAHPVNCVTWDQARSYCAFAGGRLPTEAEWERAARGDTGQRFVTGEAALAHPRAALSPPDPATGGTTPVGTHAGDRGPYGALDLQGNVSEWVHDAYDSTYYRRSPSHNPEGPRSGDGHAVRGCSFRCGPGSALLPATTRQFSLSWDPTLGFRCVRSGR
jgi:formylglycine-generating enzyme required for sulfatase activity